jgi:hypothetical protein
MASGKRTRPEKSAAQLDNEEFVLAQTKKFASLQAELNACLEKQKAVGAGVRLSGSDSDDSDQAHEDDEDVELPPDEVAKYHNDTNAASRSATSSKRCKVDVSNEVEGKRVRVATKAAPAAVATQRSARAMDEDVAYNAFRKMRMSLRRRYGKTPEEVELDSKLDAIITAIEHMYTWDNRVFVEEERVRREREQWYVHSEFVYDEVVKVAFSGLSFETRIVHECPLTYVVKVPPVGADDVPMGLRTRIIEASPGRFGPFSSRNEAEPIPDCVTIRKADTRWTVKSLVESVEEPAVTEEECPPESDEGSEEGSEDSSEDEAESSESSGDENPEDAEDEDAEDSDEEESDDDVPLSVKKADQEAVRRLLAKRKANRLKAQAQLPSGSGNKAK